MVERQAVVKNEDGIHCRPSTVIVKYVSDYTGSITVTNARGSASLSSVLELMSLELFPGTKLRIRVEGPDEDQICSDLVALFETHFDFPHKRDAPTTE